MTRTFCACAMAIAAVGCSVEEQPPEVTIEEFREVQARLWPSEGRPIRDGFFDSERGRSIVARRLGQVVGDRGASILRGATRVEAFRIADTAGIDYAFGRHAGVRSTLGKVEGYTITSKGKDLGAESAGKLSGFLLNGEHYFSSFDCLPDPGVAFRVREGDETLTLVVCYECDNLKVIVRDSWGRLVHQGRSYFTKAFDESSALRDLAREAFPGDEQVRKMVD